MALERPSRLSWSLAFGDLSSEERPALGMVALLNDRDAIEGCVELSVATAMQPIPAGRLP